MGAITDKLRETLSTINEESSARLASLLASAFEKVDEDKAHDTILAAMKVMNFLPGIITLIIALTLDSRVPFIQKFNLALVIAYMIVPDDAALLALVGPVAYLDDTVVLLYSLFLLAQLIGSLDEQVIRDNWIGDPAQADELVKAAAALGGFLGSKAPIQEAQEVIHPAF